MAEFLYSIAKFAARKPWFVIGGWLVVLAMTAGALGIFGSKLNTNITIEGLPTSEVTARLKSNIPIAAAGTGTVVFNSAEPLTAEQRAAITASINEVEKVSGIETIMDPFEFDSTLDKQLAELEKGKQELADAQAQIEQGQTQLDSALGIQIPEDLRKLAFFNLNLGQLQLDDAKSQVETGMREVEFGSTLVDLARKMPGVSADGSTAIATVMFTETLMEVTPQTKEAVRAAFLSNEIPGVTVDFSQEFNMDVPQIGGLGEVIGVAVAAVVLLVMIGTLVGAGLPLLNALVGVGIGATTALAFSPIVDMVSVTPMLGVMLGLAVGIDYSLFILNRHIRQLRQGMEVTESIALANGTSGNAVVFAGATVVIALVALNVTGIEFLGVMGTVAAFFVTVSVMIAVTLTPAVLSLLGRRIVRRKYRDQVDKPLQSHENPMSNFRAVSTLLLTVGLLVIAAIPVGSMRLGLPDGSSEPVDSSQYRAFKLIAENFGPGVNGPLVVLGDVDLNQMGPVEAQVKLAEALSQVESVDLVVPIGSSEGGTTIAVQVFPVDGPNSESTEQLVNDLREFEVANGDIKISMAGLATGNIELSDKIASVLPIYLAVVVGLSLLVLIVVFRSILVPVIATGGFILSILAAFGGVTAVYQWGFLSSIFGVNDPGPVLSFLPILLIGVLFGLAMDYQLFLTSGMREAYAHGANSRQAVIEGLHAGRNVVIAAAIIMISVFGGFIFSHLAMIRPVGFGLAFGVLVDAFFVRMMLIPSVMHLAGDKAWWLPKWLDDRLPDIDIEGANLERSHPVVIAAPEKEPVLAG